MAVEIGRVGGYEYHHDFCVDDEILTLYKHRVNPGEKTLLFEIRTNFIIRTNEGGDEITGSERFKACSYKNNWKVMYAMSGFRLEDYWMSSYEIIRLFREAIEFGEKMADDEPQYATYSVIPVVVKLDVCTVQQNGEAVEATKARAIRAENLVPLHLCSVQVGGDEDKEHGLLRLDLIDFLLKLPKIRVREVNQGLGLMTVCAICSRAPTVGAVISSLHRSCSHAFHTGCIVRRLLETNLCPTCGAQAYDPVFAERRRLPYQ